MPNEAPSALAPQVELTLRILLVAGSERSRACLQEISPIVLQLSDTVATAVEQLRARPWDGCVVELTAGDSTNDQQTLAALAAARPSIPLISVVSQQCEERGLASLKGGATDYLLVEQMTAESVARSLRYARHLSALRERLAYQSVRLTDAHQRLLELQAQLPHRPASLQREARWLVGGRSAPAGHGPTLASRPTS